METGVSESRHPLVGLVDETIRLNGRLRSVFGEARAGCALNDSEHMVLTAVVEAQDAPTVAQIGRSMGHARQLVQRAANALRDAGLVETFENPAHKRAMLLRPTAKGAALKRQIDARADALAARLMLDSEEVAAATAALRAVRRQIEAHFRAR
ncbi:helix-turn-helix domain-containing protein [Novosphingobium resinovorum]|uniref:Transcriptional regulator n=1 Tax=Novosphingobium resinovorum TaxID=158500 RepID=A0A1D8A240_9SPHN|nr:MULTISPECIES: helix-turn-helix domain-containing protein [Sphingomonadaceae]AOR76188.1 transcriptional regulator [Novosphingobium resinovorum]EJU12054.1 MarR family transcriptional regulator [Sphingomonas sp. LH128]MBF7011597.1 MarR family transcriptional regulator [Novosphingobium sp. HR1a]WJM26356.1 helix-turn-helix domain-containing protein [Novosphingobium resinovorum]